MNKKKYLFLAILPTLLCSLIFTSCTSSSSFNANSILNKAEVNLRSAKSVEFQISSSNTSGSGPYIISGNGVAIAPEGFGGTFQIMLSGFPVSVKVVSVANKFYIQLPFLNNYEVVNPNEYNFGNSAQLLNNNTGLAGIIKDPIKIINKGQSLDGNEVLDLVELEVPGKKVSQLLMDNFSSQPVNVLLGITTHSYIIRTVEITAHFFTNSQYATYYIVLEGYNSTVKLPNVGS